MATSPAPRPNWLTRLKNLPRRWWIAFFAISLVAHVIGVGTVLVLLFGGRARRRQCGRKFDYLGRRR